MTVKNHRSWLTRVRFALHQALIVILINVPTVSFGLALGWVSLVSGETAGEDSEAAGRGAVVAAVTTFTASVVGVPLSARALAAGRKFALLATSVCFVVEISVYMTDAQICWSLKLTSEWGGIWCVVAARVAAGLGGAAAWALSPLLAREMCSTQYGGAAVSALAVAHNLGVLLMYIAADLAIPQRNLWFFTSTVLATCLVLSLLHCLALTRVPDSPSYLAAKGRTQEALRALAWCRGRDVSDPALAARMHTLPPLEKAHSSWALVKDMLSDARRRRAFTIAAISVIGQEACGVLAILQYAERVFVLARDESLPAAPALVVTSAPSLLVLPTPAPAIPVLTSPARHALLLGAVQLVMSVLALYLVERVGRRPLIVWCATITGTALAAAACLAGPGSTNTEARGAWAEWRGAALGTAVAVAVAADAAGLQPAPYALLADMFHYKYRSCAMMLATLGACAGNAVEVVLFPAAASAGLRAALALAATLTLAYAAFAAAAVPETRGRVPEEIYEALGPTTVPAVVDAPADLECGGESTNL